MKKIKEFESRFQPISMFYINLFSFTTLTMLSSMFKKNKKEKQILDSVINVLNYISMCISWTTFLHYSALKRYYRYIVMLHKL